MDSDSTNYAIELIQEILNKQAGLPTTIDSNKMFVTKLKETPIYSASNVTSELIGTVDKGTQFVYEDREAISIKYLLVMENTDIFLTG